MGGLTPPRVWSADVEFDVAPAVGLRGPVMMRGWVKGPQTSTGTERLVYCIAGGGCSTGYFDLEVSDQVDYSMADYFARAGILVAALDHPGIGLSDPVPDLFELTATRVAAAHDLAARVLRTQLETTHGSRIVPIGLGHSMGGLIATVAQGRHRTFEGLISLGHAGTGLPEVLTEVERGVVGPDLPAVEPAVVGLARVRFDPNSTIPRRQPARGKFFADDVPESVRVAFAGQSAPLLYSCGLTSMIPGLALAEQSAVGVPTFVAFGDQDLTVGYDLAAAHYSGAPRVDVFVLAGSGHCHNQAGTRTVLWDRILNWITSL